MERTSKSDYSRVQIDWKPSCPPPPTLGKAGNNCNVVALKSFPGRSAAANLRGFARPRLLLLLLPMVTHYTLSMASRLLKRPKIQTWFGEGRQRCLAVFTEAHDFFLVALIWSMLAAIHDSNKHTYVWYANDDPPTPHHPHPSNANKAAFHKHSYFLLFLTGFEDVISLGSSSIGGDSIL